MMRYGRHFINWILELLTLTRIVRSFHFFTVIVCVFVFFYGKTLVCEVQGVVCFKL